MPVATITKNPLLAYLRDAHLNTEELDKGQMMHCIIVALVLLDHDRLVNKARTEKDNEEQTEKIKIYLEDCKKFHKALQDFQDDDDEVLEHKVMEIMTKEKSEHPELLIGIDEHEHAKEIIAVLKPFLAVARELNENLDKKIEP